MKKITLLKSALLLCALVAVSGSVWADDTYVKVTSLDELTIGGYYLLADVSGSTASAMGELSTGSSQRGTIVSLSASGNYITVTGSDDPYVFELEEVTSEVYSLKISGSTKDYMSYKSGTGLQILTSTSDDKAKWTITNNATYGIIVTNKSSTDRVFLRNGSSAISSYSNSNLGKSGYYTTTLYKKVIPVSIPSSGYASLVSADKLDFSSAITNVTAAYKATVATSGSGVTLTSLSGVVATSTPIIIKGTASNTAYIPATSATATANVSGNLLSGSATDAQDIAANEAYILKGGKFCLVTDASSVPAGKAYLLANKVDGGANELTFVIDEENSGTTGIEKTIVNKATDGQIYNLAGQRVAQPTKGLYIVNGKKVIVK